MSVVVMEQQPYRGPVGQEGGMPISASAVEAAATARASGTPPKAPLRVIEVPDVVKALEIAAKRLGDVERSQATLRSWAQKGRVTPGGQLLTVEAINLGIERWKAERSATAATSTAAAGSTKTEAPAAAVASVAVARKRLRGRGDTQGTSQAAEDASVDGRATGSVPEPEATGEEASGAKRLKSSASWKEAKKERQKEEARVRDLTKQRMGEVAKEIDGHMAEILRRAAGPEAVEEWKQTSDNAEKREVYMRLVHRQQVRDVQQPEELNAELLPHQLEGLEWLASLHTNGLHGILADEMGLGKTIQSIALMLYIKEHRGDAGPHLIVTPKSTLSNWQSEFAKFAPNFRLHVLTGDQDVREAALATLQRDVAEGRAVACVTNYEQVYRNEALARSDWHIVVVDEGHKLKNPDTVIHATMAQLRCKMRLLLTGTPIQNRVNELWALFHYLLPDLFTCMMDFKTWFVKPFAGIQGLNEFAVQLSPEQEQEVIQQMHSLLAPFLLQRLKSEVLAEKLPERVDFTVRVPLSAWQQTAYKDLEQKTIKLLGDDNSVTNEQVSNALMQLRKITLHPYLFQESYPSDSDLFRTSGKVEALDRLLQKLLRFRHKVLVFSQFTSILDILENFLAWRSIPNVRLDGQVSHTARRDRMRRFAEDQELRVFLLSARAGNLGLNLQAADTVILFDMDWNPQNDKQAVARVHRVGQTRPVRVVRLVADAPVERLMEQRCQEKLEMEQKILGAGMFRKKATVEQRRDALRAMLGLTPGAASGADSQGIGAPPVRLVEAPGSDLTPAEQVCELLARSEEERATFAEMDARALKPQRGLCKSLPPLVRCGRLMRMEEVPAGFQPIAVDED